VKVKRATGTLEVPKMTRTGLVLTSLLLVRVSFGQTSPPNIVLILTDDQGWTSTSVQLDPNEPDSVSDF